MGGGALDFVIVGAQRGGSTNLATSIADHPMVFLPPDEVPFYEDPFFGASSPDALDPLFADARTSAATSVGIHCPSYLARTEVAPRLHAAAPDARILAVLRDPVARAISAYSWYVQFGMLPLVSVEEGLGRLLDGWTDPAYPQAWEILDWSLYGRHLRPYYELFGREQVLVLLSDETREPGAYEGIYRFLGVDPTHRPAPKADRRNEGVYHRRRLRWLRARHRLAWSWAETDTYSYRPRRLRHAARFIPNAVIVGVDRVVLSRLFPSVPPVLSADLEQRLQHHYAADVEALQDLIGRRLPQWGGSRR